MINNQKKDDAKELWNYFEKVIEWVQTVFTEYRDEMKKVEWGLLYNKHKNDNLDPNELEEKIAKYMEDEDITNQKGIYTYILDGDEKNLNIRKFSKRQKQIAYEQQNGICAM